MTTILCLAPYKFLPAKTGGQKNIAFFYKYLGKHAILIAASVETNCNSLAENYTSLNVFSNTRFRYFNPLYFYRLKKIINQYNVTHVLLEHPYMGWLGILLKRSTSKKLIIHSHNIEGLRFKTLGKWWWKLLWQYEKYVHTKADYNLFIQNTDQQYAIENFGLEEKKCIVMSYGIEHGTPPAYSEIQAAKDYVRSRHKLKDEEKILLFVGAFDYKPNLEALDIIIKILNPLLSQSGLAYKIIICGQGLNKRLNEQNIIITGFVEDIDTYFKSADVFINPILSGGGIKTKLVEALGWNVNTVSTEVGAIGVDPTITKEKLILVKSNDWIAFAEAILKAFDIHQTTPPEFYQYFFWGYSSKKVAAFIQTD